MTVLEGQNHTSDEELYELIDERILEYGQARYLPLKERAACLIPSAGWECCRSWWMTVR